MIGGIPALKRELTGNVSGIEYTNITVWFSVSHDQETDDGTIELVTPTKYLARARRTFEAFVSRISFDKP